MLSIEAQLSELNAIAGRAGLADVETFTESKSAKGPGRPIFNEMLPRIERSDAHAICARDRVHPIFAPLISASVVGWRYLFLK